MKVLVACEESQRVCTAFRAKGHEAYSCDIEVCSGGHPEWHICNDALDLINGNTDFFTCDGKLHTVNKWDLLIAHPPCTYLSNAGAVRLYKRINGKSYIEVERYRKGIKAKNFFMAFLNANVPKIAVENPIPSSIYMMPKYTQIIQPYQFGHPYSKKTCLWLKGLPALEATNVVAPICSWVSGGSKRADGGPRTNCGMTFRDSKTRSKTFLGIASAMAEQWGGDKNEQTQKLLQEPQS